MRRFRPELEKGAAASADKAGKDAGERFTGSFTRHLKVGAAIGAAMAVAAGAQFMREATREASNLGESLNAVAVTFGENAAGIEELGRKAANTLGLSQSEFNGLAVQFSAFTRTIAGDGGDVTRTMEELTTRGADFASVMNLDVNEAMRLFQSGLAGETEPLRRFGIDLSAAAVESHAYATGIAETGAALTETEKVQARYSLLMQQTAVTQGDFANTADSLANVQRRLGANWDDIQAKVGMEVIPILERLSGWVVDVGLPALQRLGGWIKNSLAPAFGVAFGFVKDTVIPALADFGGWIQRNSSWLLPFVGALAGFGAVIWVIVQAKRAWAAAQALLNLVLAANPIGLVIAGIAALVAALVVVYQRSETFRAIVDAAFRAVAAAGQWMWENVLRPVFTFIGAAFTAVATGIAWAWANLIQPTWSAVASVAGWLWNTILSPIFTAIGFTWDAVSAGIAWAWNNVIKPVWDALGAAAGFLWNNILSPIFNAVGTAWDGLARGMQWVYNNLIAPIFDWFRGVLDTIRSSFQTAVDFIARVWEGLKDALLAPVQFVIDFVWNNGLRKLWNLINNIWDGDDIAPFVINRAAGGVIPPVTGRGGVQEFATGGVLPGYTPGRDVHKFVSPTGGILNLSGGEAVMRPEFTRALGKANIDVLNRIARQEGEAGLRRALEHGVPTQSFALGGNIQLGNRDLSWAENLALSALPFFSPLGGNVMKPLTDYIRDEAEVTKNQGDSPWWQALGGTFRNAANKIWDWIKGKIQNLVGDNTLEGVVAKPIGAAGALGGNYTSMFAAIKAAFPGARLTSGYRPGDPGYHGRGKAVDIGGPSPAPAGSAFMAGVKTWLYNNHRGSLAELIYNGIGNAVPNWWKGRNHAYSAGTQAQHRNHVHAAVYDQGGLWPAGWAGFNMTNGVERVLTPPQDDYFRRFVDLTRDGSSRGPLIGVVNLNEQRNPGATLDELEHRLRIADLGGRYGSYTP